jgi:hypothetical protein
MDEHPNDPSTLDKAKDAAKTVSDTVQTATQKIGVAIEAGRQPGAPLDKLSEWTRDAPLHAILVAFLLGWMAGRRR